MKIKKTIIATLFVLISSGCTTRASNTPPAAFPNPPWLLYIRDHQLILSSVDGMDHYRFAAFGFSANIQIFPAPGLERLAIINGADPILSIFSLPEGGSIGSYELIENPDLTTEEQNQFAADFAANPAGLATWSPNAALLAFISVRDTFYPELHILNQEDNRLSLISVGTHEIQRNNWSSDSHWLAFETDRDNESGGNHLCNLVAIPNMEMQSIPVDPDLDCRIIGWSGDGQLILNQTNITSQSTLILYDPLAQTLDTIWSGEVGLVALDTTEGILAVTTITDSEVGLILVHIDGDQLTLPISGSNQLLWQESAGIFLAENRSGWIMIHPNGDTYALTGEHGTPTDSENLVAFFSNGFQEDRPGIRLYDQTGSLIQSLGEYRVDHAEWTESENQLFFLSENQLFSFLPGYSPLRLEDAISTFTLAEE